MGDYVALYGNIALVKGYCKYCRDNAFVVAGIIQCCGVSFEPKPQFFKREFEPENRKRRPPPKYRKEQLMRQGNRCLYCERTLETQVIRGARAIRLRIEWDHMLPHAFSQDNRETNFVAACHICNSFKSNLVFQTLEQARIFILDKWKHGGYI